MNRNLATRLFLHFFPCTYCNSPLKDDRVLFMGKGGRENSWKFKVQCSNCKKLYATDAVFTNDMLLQLIGDLTPMEWVKRTKGRADDQPVSVEYQNWIK